MNVDDRLLMSYVDDLLSAKARAKVERMIAQSDEVAGRVAALRASCVPYEEAFGSFASIPVPETLSRRIDDLVESHTTNVCLQNARNRNGWSWLAVAFFAGVMSSGVGFEMFQSPPAMRSATPGWVQAVVDYQTLYTRDTVVNVKDDHAATTRLVRAIQREDGLAVRVPDLSGDHLAFKRIQRLSYHNARLVQMVYMPDAGQPVALCVVADARADEAPRVQKVGDMNTVTWRHARLSYALVAKGDAVNLREVAAKIVDGSAGAMYG